jgi:hypothetical protein
MPEEVAALKKYEVAVWLVSLGLIFLVVSSIGAISLHSALQAFSAETGGAVYDNNREAMGGRRLQAEYASLHAEAPGGRFAANGANSGNAGGVPVARSVEARVNEFVSSYTAGVIDARLPSRRSEYLLDAVTKASEEVAGSSSAAAA